MELVESFSSKFMPDNIPTAMNFASCGVKQEPGINHSKEFETVKVFIREENLDLEPEECPGEQDEIEDEQEEELDENLDVEEKEISNNVAPIAVHQGIPKLVIEPHSSRIKLVWLNNEKENSEVILHDKKNLLAHNFLIVTRNQEGIRINLSNKKVEQELNSGTAHISERDHQVNLSNKKVERELNSGTAHNERDHQVNLSNKKVERELNSGTALINDSLLSRDHQVSVAPKKVKQEPDLETLLIKEEYHEDENEKTVHPALEKTEENHLLNGRNLTCGICGDVHKTDIDMLNHMRVHAGYAYKCLRCNFRSKSMNAFKVHNKKHGKLGDACDGHNKKSSTSFPCGDCSKSYKSFHNLVAHKRKHKIFEPQIGGPYRCYHCDFEGSKPAFLVHMKNHTGEKRFKCRLCTFNSTVRRKIETHERLIHDIGGNPVLTCTKCNYSTCIKGFFERHLKKHNVTRLFQCEYCSYSSSYRYNFVSHMRRHTGEKPYKCQECNYKCAQSSSLVSHMRMHSGEKKTYACKYCSYTTYLKTRLMHHISTHTGENPFKCERCSFKCLRQNILKLHMRKHKKNNYLICDECDFKCLRQNILKLHMRKHIKKNYLICDECGFKTLHKNGLIVHMRTHITKANSCARGQFLLYS